MKNTEKINLFKQLKADYQSPMEPLLVETTPGNYLSLKGEGKPGGKRFQRAVETLYSIAYTVKMMRKKNGLGDYVVGKLETIWDVDMSDLNSAAPDVCLWKLLIRTPEMVTFSELKHGVDALLAKGKITEVENVTLERIDEGPCIQMLHVGPYEDEGRTLEIMKAFMEKKNLTCRGGYHEIYISDPRRIEPARLKTILRLPVISPDL